MTIQEILKKVGVKGRDLSEKLGINYDWYRKATMRSKKVKPNWVNAFILGFELGVEYSEKNKNE